MNAIPTGAILVANPWCGKELMSNGGSKDQSQQSRWQFADGVVKGRIKTTILHPKLECINMI
jgi:hypothetical protein